MKMNFIFICLISELLCIQYLPKDGIINLPTDSNNGSIYLNSTDFPSTSSIYLFFRVSNGLMDSGLPYAITDSEPFSDDELSYDNTLNYINSEKDNETIIIIYKFDSLIPDKYYAIKYSGFTGNSINVACSLFNAIAKYIPIRDIIELPTTKLNSYIYLKYDDFNDSKDIYLRFQVSNGNLNPDIQYQETDVDPGYTVSFPTPKVKRYDYRNKIEEFFFCFSKSNYKYLLIYYTLESLSIIRVSSSIQIQHVTPRNIINLNSKLDYGYIYLKFEDFQTADNIFLYFQTSFGEMNNYVEYVYSNDIPIYEELFTSLERKYFDDNEKASKPNFHCLELPSDNYNIDIKYMVIKYSGFSGKSILVSGSIGIRYLSNDNIVDITSNKHQYGYVYLDYKDFENSGDENYFYLLFKISNGNMDENINYINTNIYPIYEGQFSFADKKEYEKKDIINEPHRYIYKFEKKSNFRYISIYYTGFTGNSLCIFSSSTNPSASFVAIDKTISLSSSSRSGFIYISYSDFSNEDNIYISFNVKGKIDSKINYINTNFDPSMGDCYSSMNSKECDNKDDKSATKIYSFKFNKENYQYFVIKYSGFNGSEIKVSCSKKDPLSSSTLIIVSISIGSLLIIIIIVIIIFLIIKNRSKRKSEIYKLIEPDKPNEFYPINAEENSQL